MGLDRSKFKNIVGGITTPVPPEAPAIAPSPEPVSPATKQPAEVTQGQGGRSPIRLRKPRRRPPSR